MVFLFAAVGTALVFLAHTAPFPFILDSVAPGEAVWHIPHTAGPPTVYLTFDDGPNPDATPDLLDVLADVNAPATFFLIDQHLTEQTAPIVRRMFAEGHAVGVHSHTRRLMWQSPQALADTVAAAADRIEALAGTQPCRVFRPHAGWRSGQMYEGLASIDFVLVGWGWGLWDWNWYRPRQPEGLAHRLARRASAGDIIVIHDGHHKNPRANRRYAVEATALFVPALRERGFKLGTLC